MALLILSLISKSANSVTHTAVALSAVVMDTHPLKAHRCLPMIHPCMLPAGTCV